MRFIVCIAMAALSVIAAAPAPAAVTPDESIVLDRWELQLGGFLTRINTKLRFPETENRPGGEISFEDDLDFDDTDNLFRFAVGRLFGKRHELRGTYFGLERDSLLTFETEIDVGDETIPIGADIDVVFDTELATVDYTYWVVAGAKTAFGISGGLTLFDLKTGVDIVNPDIGDVILELDTDVPVPQIGLRVRHALSQKFVFLGEGTFLRFRDVSDVDGDIWGGRLGIEHRSFRYIGFGAQLSINRYNLSTGDSKFNVDFEYDIEGFYFYLRGTFGGVKGSKSS